jgi:hypothetical protein
MRKAIAIALLVTASAIVVTSRDAGARSSLDSSYGYERTWNAALRLVVVDMALKVNEKDQQNGYILFDYKPSNSAKPSSGSIELVRSKDADQPVHVVVQLAEMPRYHEQVILDSLARKMKQEYGDPPRTPPPSPVTPDAGVDGSE